MYPGTTRLSTPIVAGGDTVALGIAKKHIGKKYIDKTFRWDIMATLGTGLCGQQHCF
jgi:hypothetical protein